MFVGSTVKVWSLIWPRDSRCRGLLWFREFTGACGLWVEGCGLLYGPRTHDVGGLQGLWALVGFAVKVWSFKWPEDPCCRCLMYFREFVGACGCLGALVGSGMMVCFLM